MKKASANKLIHPINRIIKALLLAGIVSINTIPVQASDNEDMNLKDTYDKQTYSQPEENALNDAGKYAVFAKTYYAQCDMEGNVAVKNLYLNATSLGLSSNVDGLKLSYVEKICDCSDSRYEIAKTTNSIDPLIIGNEYKIIKNNGWEFTENGQQILTSPQDKITDIVNIENSKYQIDFDSSFDNLKKFSNNLSQMNTTDGTCTRANLENENGSIECKNGTNICNLSMEQYNQLNNFNIDLPDNSILIVNMNDYNGQVLNGNVTINGARQSYKGNSCNVIWNFGNYSSTVNFQETTVGCILAPSATVEINSTHNGNIVADTVKNSGGEIHKNDINKNIKIESNNVVTEKSTSTSNNETTNSVNETKVNTQITSYNNQETNGKTSPETGDHKMKIIWIPIIALSAFSLVLMAFGKRKEF